MTGKVCDKHQEWCPTGECRWCEPPSRSLYGIDAKQSQWVVPPIPTVVHFPGCAQSPCSCPAIAAGHASHNAQGVVIPPAVSCKCGAIILADPGAHYDEPAYFFRHTAASCGPQGPGSAPWHPLSP